MRKLESLYELLPNHWEWIDEAKEAYDAIEKVSNWNNNQRVY